jgi:hypothetical protein
MIKMVGNSEEDVGYGDRCGLLSMTPVNEVVIASLFVDDLCLS